MSDFLTKLDLLERAIARSSLSGRKFAELIAWRDERTLRRWRAGNGEVPDVVARRLRWFLSLSRSNRKRLVRIVTIGGDVE